MLEITIGRTAAAQHDLTEGELVAISISGQHYPCRVRIVEDAALLDADPELGPLIEAVINELPPADLELSDLPTAVLVDSDCVVCFGAGEYLGQPCPHCRSSEIA